MLGRNWNELDFINNTYLFLNNNTDFFNLYITCFSEDPLIENLPECYNKIYIEKNQEYLYSLRINPKYEEDYLRFILGEYSNFTLEYRQEIYKLLGKHFKSSNIYRVIEKDPRLKKELELIIGEALNDNEELASIYNQEKETYRYE